MCRAADTDAHAGDTVRTRPDFIVAYDFPGWVDAMIDKLVNVHGVEQLPDPERYVVFVDHLVTRGNETEKRAHDRARRWAEANGVDVHVEQGIGHQLTAEMGYAAPGRLLVHFDAHISAVGALGAIGFGLHRQLLDAWITGAVDLEIPRTARVELVGTIRPGIDGRDLLHTLIAQVGASGFLGQVVEFSGSGTTSLSLDQRQALCGMVMFAGAVSAVFAPDELSLSYAADHARGDFTPEYSDPGCDYVSDTLVRLDQLEPQVVLPGSTRPEHTKAVGELAGTPVGRGFIGSCASGRIEDLRAAADVLRGHHVRDGFRLIVVPTTERIRAQADAEGTLEALRSAGAEIGKSSCDHCFGYADPLDDGEVCVSTSVLNVRGRMGSIGAEIYMASAATVAATALTGVITDPRSVHA
jgi:3-isopropylmalate/(R)-2-methylmalate dehydratase large subunit